MLLIPKFCNQCGASVEERVVEERLRPVCTECQTIFYQNPVPVAAAIVLNEKREVLLVKRKNPPQENLWCLPMGFAEINETIVQAAIRELKEETAIKGKVMRLVDVASTVMEVYGDILVVTYQVEKIEGTELAGDDALKVGYFPMDRLPAMAFDSNTKAIRYCQKAYQEQWAVEDSFNNLLTNKRKGMLSDVLINFIGDHSMEIARLWYDEVQKHPTTKSYRKIDSEHLMRRVAEAISQFGNWLSGNETDKEIKRFYMALGEEREKMGFDIFEVISSLTLLRKHILSYAHAKGVWEGVVEPYRVLELDTRIMLFFDKAIYYTARGFKASSIA